MSLKDKEKQYGHSGFDDRVFQKEDVAEAVNEFDNYTLCYIPNHETKCETCNKDKCIMYREDHKKSNITKRYVCDSCLRLEIFGDFKK